MLAQHRRWLTVAIVLLAFSRDVGAQELAQERLFAVVPDQPGSNSRKMIEIDTKGQTFGAVLAEWPIPAEPPADMSGFQSLAHGRYLVWTSGLTLGLPAQSLRLNVFDTLSGTTHVFAQGINGSLVAVDSDRARLFIEEPQRIAVIDVRSRTVSYISRPSLLAALGTPSPAAYAAYADWLFIRRRAQWELVDVIDVSSGAVIKTIAITARVGIVLGLATDSTGARLYAVESGRVVSAHDTATSTRIARGLLDQEEYGLDPRQLIQLDEQRRRVLVRGHVALNADTLERIGEVRGACAGVPFGRRCFSSHVSPFFSFFGPRSPLFLFTSRTWVDFQSGAAGCELAPLERRDAETGQLLQVVDLAPLVSTAIGTQGFCSIQMVMTTVPSVPRAFTSAVRGRQVTLSWTDPGNATHFDIEASAAPGLGNLYQQSVQATTVTIDNVPPGTYYVRVRAINYVGRSAPAEIVVIVQ